MQFRPFSIATHLDSNYCNNQHHHQLKISSPYYHICKWIVLCGKFNKNCRCNGRKVKMFIIYVFVMPSNPREFISFQFRWVHLNVRNYRLFISSKILSSFHLMSCLSLAHEMTTTVHSKYFLDLWNSLAKCLLWTFLDINSWPFVQLEISMILEIEAKISSEQLNKYISKEKYTAKKYGDKCNVTVTWFFSLLNSWLQCVWNKW